MTPLSEYDANRVKRDAMEAIEALQAIVKECNKKFSFPYYIREKAEKANRCVTFIESTAIEYLKPEQEEES